MIQVSQAITQGDVTQKVSRIYPGLFGQLSSAINDTVLRLQDMVGMIRPATQAIEIATRDIAAGNQDSSCRLADEASSLQETAVSVEQLNAAVTRMDQMPQKNAALVEQAAPG